MQPLLTHTIKDLQNRFSLRANMSSSENKGDRRQILSHNAAPCKRFINESVLCGGEYLCALVFAILECWTWVREIFVKDQIMWESALSDGRPGE
ncbi:hypothetical protein ROHU_015857 [Labeo rohita]|uniref:Uncharacterized protein n=1 Tax=Labeo rohita TaxID=84645 RepID=A0A498NMD0_LABRO|nr:hypothetical protein ROHU_015857 [Labeo rohita]